MEVINGVLEELDIAIVPAMPRAKVQLMRHDPVRNTELWIERQVGPALRRYAQIYGINRLLSLLKLDGIQVVSDTDDIEGSDD